MWDSVEVSDCDLFQRKFYTSYLVLNDQLFKIGSSEQYLKYLKCPIWHLITQTGLLCD